MSSTRLRIGFDAKWYFRGPPSGRLVVRHLIPALAALAKSHELVVFLDRRDRAYSPPFEHRAISYEYIWGQNNLVANQISLPRRARELRLDVVVYQNFVPVAADHGRVAFIYDAIFDERPEFFTWKERAMFAPMRLLSKRAECICTISKAERDRLIRLDYGASDSIIVATLGVPENFSIPPAHEALMAVSVRHQLPDRFVLYVGRLNVRKNISNLLRAMAHLRDGNISLVVVGSRDWKSTNWRAEAASLGLGDRIIFLGHVADDDVSLIYRCANVLCFPSLDEGFGLPALEAMASGTPVVVSDIPPLREVCGNAAMYVNPRQPEDIARAIDELLVSPKRVAILTALGRRRASEFTWERTARALLTASEQAFVSAKQRET